MIKYPQVMHACMTFYVHIVRPRFNNQLRRNSLSIKLVSFNVWNTLVKANELYRYNRAVLLAQAVGARPSAIEDDEFIDAVMYTIDQAEKFLDDQTTTTGQQHGFGDYIRFICEQRMGVILPDLGPLYNRMSDTLLHALPELTEPALPTMLATLKGMGLKVTITSNTGFMAGNLMRAMLASVGLYSYVDFGLFSDEIGAIVPSRQSFAYLQQVSGFTAEETLHIGANANLDYHGALAVGVSALLYAPKSDAVISPNVLQRLTDLPSCSILAK